MVKKICWQVLIFMIGAIGYPCIEMLYRAGHTHWTMTLVGGFAFLAIIDVNYILKQRHILVRILSSTLMVTLVELVAGLIINKLLRMGVWDYSNIQYNLEGQICLQFSLYWMILCTAVILLFEVFLYIRKFIMKLLNKKEKELELI